MSYYDTPAGERPSDAEVLADEHPAPGTNTPTRSSTGDFLVDTETELRPEAVRAVRLDTLRRVLLRARRSVDKADYLAQLDELIATVERTDP